MLLLTYEVAISRAQFELNFHPVHPGQNFVGIDYRRFKLQFFPIVIGISYKIAITPAEFLITNFSTPDTVNTIHYRSDIVEASFAILTSRTSPEEPQPFAHLRVGRGIPQVIV